MATLRLAGIDVKALIGREVGNQLSGNEVTFVQVTEGVRVDSISGKTLTKTSFTAKGFRDDGNRQEAGQSRIDESLAQETVSTIILLGGTIGDGTLVPKPDDEIILDGTTFTIVRVTADPVEATFVCQVS